MITNDDLLWLDYWMREINILYEPFLYKEIGDDGVVHIKAGIKNDGSYDLLTIDPELWAAYDVFLKSRVNDIGNLKVPEFEISLRGGEVF